MPRTPQTPRLATLDPDQVAAEACADTLAQIDVLAERLAPATVDVSERLPRALADRSRLGRVVRDLVLYAQGHEVLGDPVEEAVQLLGLDVQHVWLDTALGVAFVAASGRRKLDAGKPLLVRELAVLGGMDPNALRFQIRAGRVRVTGRGDAQVVDPDEAKWWLEKKNKP